MFMGRTPAATGLFFNANNDGACDGGRGRVRRSHSLIHAAYTKRLLEMMSALRPIAIPQACIDSLIPELIFAVMSAREFECNVLRQNVNCWEENC
jgi:hypothetical protein